jgi:hypothetical protein
MVSFTSSDIRAIAESFGQPSRDGKGWRCVCPVCGSRTLSIQPGKVRPLLVQCWACEDYETIKTEIARRGFDLPRDSRRVTSTEKAADWESRIEYGLKWRRESFPMTGTIVERYLETRGITIGQVPSISTVFSFHPRVRHPTGVYLPAMLAPMSYLGAEKRGVHVTFLASDGRGKADIKPDRASFGPSGNAGVFLGPYVEGQEYVVGEGIETTLSAIILAGRELNGGVALGGVAAISANGLQNLELRPEMTRIVIASDVYKNNAGQIAAQNAFDRWTGEGRSVRVAYPPYVGTDFNDILLRKGPYATE